MNINKILRWLVLVIVVGGILGVSFLFLVGGQACVTRGYQTIHNTGSLVDGWDAYNRCQVSGGAF